VAPEHRAPRGGAQVGDPHGAHLGGGRRHGHWHILDGATVRADGVAESFTSVGHLEFMYARPGAREHAQHGDDALLAVHLLGKLYASTLLVDAVHRWSTGPSDDNWMPDNINHGRLDYFYWVLTPFSGAKHSTRTGGGALYTGADGPWPGARRSTTWHRAIVPCLTAGRFVPWGQTVHSCAGATRGRRRRLDLAPWRDPVGEERS
jgi:hypothetical protein